MLLLANAHTFVACPSFQDFQQVASEAMGHGRLLKGITKFLDDSLVLPAGDWNQDSMKPVIEMAKKKAHEVRRKSLHPLALNREGNISYIVLYILAEF